MSFLIEKSVYKKTPINDALNFSELRRLYIE